MYFVNIIHIMYYLKFKNNTYILYSSSSSPWPFLPTICINIYNVQENKIK